MAPETKGRAGEEDFGRKSVWSPGSWSRWQVEAEAGGLLESRDETGGWLGEEAGERGSEHGPPKCLASVASLSIF